MRRARAAARSGAAARGARRRGLAREILAAYRREGVGLLQRLHGQLRTGRSSTPQAGIRPARDRPHGDRATRLRGARRRGSCSRPRPRRWPRHLAPTRAARPAGAAQLPVLPHDPVAADRRSSGCRKLPAATVARVPQRRAAADALLAAASSSRIGPATSPALARGLRDEPARRRAGGRTRATASGAFLSGGLDSSTVAGVLSRGGPSPGPHASRSASATRITTNSRTRASPTAASAARATSTTVHGAGHRRDALPLIAEAYDEPFGNSSALPAYYCAQLARRARRRRTCSPATAATSCSPATRATPSSRSSSGTAACRPCAPRRCSSRLLGALPAALIAWLIRKARGYVAKANIPLPDRLETWNFMHRLGVGRDPAPGLPGRGRRRTDRSSTCATCGDSRRPARTLNRHALLRLAVHARRQRPAQGRDHVRAGGRARCPTRCCTRTWSRLSQPGAARA